MGERAKEQKGARKRLSEAGCDKHLEWSLRLARWGCGGFRMVALGCCMWMREAMPEPQ